MAETLKPKDDRIMESYIDVVLDCQDLACFLETLREPKCEECGSGILRPKCLWELSPTECPRHNQRRLWEKNVKKLVKEIGTPGSKVGKILLKWKKEE